MKSNAAENCILTSNSEQVDEVHTCNSTEGKSVTSLNVEKEEVSH